MMLENKSAIDTFFKSLTTIKVLVIGDVMIDSYLCGFVERISPEAPVPVVALKKRENMLGGAANVALNIESLGAKAILCSVIGKDKQGDEFISLLMEKNLTTEGILRSEDRITTTKFRIIGNKVQMLRVDEEIDSDLNSEDSTQLLSTIQHLILNQKPQVILLQDYNKGVLTAATIKAIIEVANQNGIPIAVDPKHKNFTTYKGVKLFKPNLKEISEGLKKDINPDSIESLTDAAQWLHSSQKIDTVFITLSEKGVFVSYINENIQQTNHFPAIERSIADVSGAGDTVISVAALCVACGMDAAFMAKLSNIAGGIVCEQSGVIPVDKNILIQEAFLEI